MLLATEAHGRRLLHDNGRRRIRRQVRAATPVSSTTRRVGAAPGAAYDRNRLW